MPIRTTRGDTLLDTDGAVRVQVTNGKVNVTTHSDAGDDFTVNTDKLVVEGDTGKVGINTTSPSAQLDVVADTSLSQQVAIHVTGDAGNYVQILNADQTSGSSFGLHIMSGTTNSDSAIYIQNAVGNADFFLIDGTGNVGIGMVPGHLLDLVADDAGKPATNTWTIVSDERLKDNIKLADLKRCYEIVKNLPLKRFTWKDEVYTPVQVKDRSKLGWISQDVKGVFPKGVSQGKFFSKQQVEDGTEEYEEQDFTVKTVKDETESIEIRDGIPTLIKKVTDREVKTMLFDEVPVVDESSNPVLDKDGTPRIYQIPRMIKKTRPLLKSAVEIEDCLDLNSDQIYAAMYGAIQYLMAEVEKLENKLKANK